jgi:hypothetical protein
MGESREATVKVNDVKVVWKESFINGYTCDMEHATLGFKTTGTGWSKSDAFKQAWDDMTYKVSRRTVKRNRW